MSASSSDVSTLVPRSLAFVSNRDRKSEVEVDVEADGLRNELHESGAESESRLRQMGVLCVLERFSISGTFGCL